jgi:hypothetical protein
VFEHLKDVRPWGPQDRVLPETIADWNERLRFSPEGSVRFEAEFWYRDAEERRGQAEAALKANVEQAGGQFLDVSAIPQIRYHAVLAEIPAAVASDFIAHPNDGLALQDEVMFLRPQALVGDPGDTEEDALETVQAVGGEPSADRIAALLDGVPMAQHDLLTGRLDVDDPDDFASRYGAAIEQKHGTAMASLIIHGDRDGGDTPVSHRLYVRPVTYPHDMGMGERKELMPQERLGVDLVWRAFLRMYEGVGGEPPVASSVKIINVSLGDAKRRFSGVMSPWARLIDYLAWHYRILVLVSAGNITDPLPMPDIDTWANFEAREKSEQQATVLKAILAQRANRRLLSPAEAINAITVGACHDDNLGANGAPVMALAPYESNYLPNPSSALGLGFRRGVKPDVLFPGGREKLRSNRSDAPIEFYPVPGGRYHGVKAASPDPAGRANIVHPFSGTSVATALATHSAIKIVEMLQQIPNEPAYPNFDPAYAAVIAKALLIHSAKWDADTALSLKAIINPLRDMHFEHERDELTRVLSFGRANIERVLECAAERATLVGWGEISADEADQYQVPLPPGLDDTPGPRAVHLTVAWLTPLNLRHQMYRMAKLEASAGTKNLFQLAVAPTKAQPFYHAVGRGTVWHQSWEGEAASEFDEDGRLAFSVSCKASAGELDQSVPYAVALSIEVGQGVNVPVYEQIRQRLRAPVRVRP